MRIIRISVVILFSVFFIAIVTPSHAFDATEQNIAILDDKIERLEDDVSIWKTEVQKLEDRARRYDRMANDAKKEAEKSKQQADKDHWIESAKKRSERVNNLREDIKNISGKIEKAENEIRTLKGEKNQKVKAQQGQQVQSDKTAKEHADKKREIKESTRNEDTCQLQYPEELFGLWHYDDDTDSNPLAIVQEDPEVNAYPNRLELHNHDRIWKGTFNSSKDLRKDKPRMVFKYKPKVEEVNENLPDWVAAGLEGQLEWEMEIWTECDHGIAMPHALFYPGKIEWDEEAKTYDIVGRGEGRRFDLNPVSHMTLESYANAAIGISVDKTQDPFIRPIEALTKRQRFNVVVRLPADMAEEVGKTIEVQLKGLENGDTDILELKAGRSSGNNPVLYQHGKPITIADSRDWRENPRRQKFLSLNYLFGDAGDMMDLDVENEEVVEFSYKDLKFEVPVYQTHYQRGHARFQQAAERMDAFYGSVLYGENTEEQKQRARTKLRMLFNYKKIISSEYINDRHRYNIGEVYFGDAFGSYGLLQMTEEQLQEELNKLYDKNAEREDADPINPLLQAALEGGSGKDMSIKSGKAADQIVWTSDTEKFSVIVSLKKTSMNLRKEIMDVVHRDLSFGIYGGITSATGADSVYLVATGTDAFGRAVPTWQRVQAAIGLGSGAILTVTGANVVQKFAAKPRKHMVAVSHKSGTSFSAIRNKHSKTKGVADPSVPKTLKPSQKNQTTSKAKEKNVEADNIETDVYPEEFKRAKSEREEFEQLFTFSPLSKRNKKHTREFLLARQDPYIKKQYPSSTKLVKNEIDTMSDQASIKNCQAMALIRIIKRKTGNEISEVDMHLWIDRLIDIEMAKNPIRPVSFGHGIVRGYKNWMIRHAGRAFGFRVAEINVTDNVRKIKGGAKVTQNSAVTLRSLRPILEAGGGIKAIVKLKGGTHAVSVEGLTVNKRGFITHVRFYDSNVPGVLEVPAIDFRKMLVSKDNTYGSITVFM